MTHPQPNRAGRRILVTGASVAGNALSWWLSRRGFDVTVVERHPEFRDGGQNVDVRGAGREVLKKMGLEKVVADSGTVETGVRFVDADDNSVAQFDVEELGADGPTAELEILRGDLARIFYDACGDRVKFRFDDAIEGVAESGDGVDVSFKSATRAAYDLVVVAEGVGSATRELVFPGENEPRWLDVTMGYFTIPKGAGDGDLCRIYTAGEGRSIWLRPDNKGTTRAILTIQREPDTDDRLSREEQVRRTSADAILNSSPRVNVAERRARYAEQGWTRFDETADAYTNEQIAAERDRYRVNRL